MLIKRLQKFTCDFSKNFSCYDVLYTIIGCNAIMNLVRLFKNLGWFFSSYYILDNLPDAVLIVDKTGLLVSYNKRAKEIFGFVEGGFGQYHLQDIIKDSKNVISTSLRQLKPVLATAIMPDREFYIELNAVSRFNGYHIVIRDLTTLTNELKNEDKIVRFNSEKNAMLAKIEDDITAPISSISGFSQGLLDGLGGDLSEKQEKYVKIIHNNSMELSEFLGKLLLFSKVESSVYEANYKTFDVIELVKNLSKDFQQHLEARGVALVVDGETLSNRNVYTDICALHEALKNILEASSKMTEKGYISVKLSNPDEDLCAMFKIHDPKHYLHIEIRDTGVGIAEDEMKYLCEPYAQLEKGKKNLLRAFRLGIASILTKRANGYITIKSEVMKGTRYEIILPIEKR